MPSHRAIKPVVAALLAACVLLLGLAAVSPDLHERLCHHEDAHAAHASHEAASTDSDNGGDAACAVTLFAAGCETPVAFQLCPPLALNAEGVASFTELLLARTLRGPERVCGPPARA